MRIKSMIVVGLAVALGGGCAKRQMSKLNSEEDALMAKYDGSEYQKDMVQADESTDYADQGSSVSPKTMASIQDAITNVYERDLGRCLQEDMDEYNNRWIAGTFSVEFTIDTKGKVTAVELLEEDIQERRLPPGVKEARKAVKFGPCIERAIYKWEFDPAPEVVYVHTYSAKVGEAF